MNNFILRFGSLRKCTVVKTRFYNAVNVVVTVIIIIIIRRRRRRRNRVVTATRPDIIMKNTK